MAQNATVFKVALDVADIDRAYYHAHALTIARHPSETDERMMVRLLAFARHAHEALAFGRGLGTDDEPDLWRKDLTGAIDLWIDVGQPDEKRIRRAGGRAEAEFVYSDRGGGGKHSGAEARPGVAPGAQHTDLTPPLARTALHCYNSLGIHLGT